MLDNASDTLVQDVDTIFKNAGVSRDDFFNNIGDAKTKAHEYFAKSFEAYLREGKAPTPELQGAFDRIKQWLVQVYHNITKDLGIQLNGEMRDVFDRLLATPEQLAAQKSLQEINTLLEAGQSELESIQNEINELESKKDLNEYYIPQNSNDAEQAITGILQEQDRYEQKLEEYNYARQEIINFLKENNINFKSLADYIGKEAAQDLRRKWRGIISSKGGFAVDIVQQMINNQFEYDGVSHGFQGASDVNSLIDWLQNVDSLKPVKPAPIVEVNEDTFKALTDMFGTEAARGYLNERLEYLKKLMQAAKYERQKNKQALEKAQGEVSRLERILKTSKGQENNTEINRQLTWAKKNLQDIKAEFAASEFDIRDIYNEQKKIAGEFNDTLKFLSGMEYFETREDDTADIPEWLINWNREHPEQTEEQKTQEKTEKAKRKQQQLFTLQEAMNKGYQMAEKYSKIGYQEGKKVQKAIDKQKSEQKIAKLKENHKLLMQRQAERRAIKNKAAKIARAINRMADSKSVIWHSHQDIQNFLDTYDVKKLNQLSLQDIQYLYSKVKDMYDTGRRELAAKRLMEYERIEQARQELRATMPEWESLNQGPVRNQQDLQKEYKGLKGFRNRIIDWTMAKTMSAQRFFDFLDNGKNTFKGAWVKYFVDNANAAYDTELRYKLMRTANLETIMQNLGITHQDLTKARDVGIPFRQGKQWTLDELLSIYAGMKNPHSREAILYGNFREAGDQAEAWAAKCIEALSDNEKQLADTIIKEYEQHFERLNNAFINIYNQGMQHEENYTPMRRIEYTSSNNSMINPDAADALNSQSGSGMYSVERGFTQNRKTFNPQNQNGIQLGLVSMWQQHVEAQEHFMAFQPLNRDLRRILLGRGEGHTATIRQMVKQTRGKVAWDMIRQYFNILARNDVQNAYDTLQDVSKYMAKNMSVAYLCGNMGTVLKQMNSFWRVWPHAGPTRMLNAIGQFMRNPRAFLDQCYELDPQLRVRNGDPFVRALQESSDGMYKRLLSWGLEPIALSDRITSAISFKAVYDANIKHGLSHNEAVKQAQKVVLLTQPATSMKDKPLMWQQNGYARLAMMFTNDMAQTFGITVYDMVQDIRRGEIPHVLSNVVGLTLAAAMIKILSSGFPDKWPWEDLAELAQWIMSAFTEQSIQSIPVIGKELITLWDSNAGYFDGHSAFVATFAKLMSGVRGLWDDKKDNNERAILNLIEDSALLAPFPATALRRLWNLLKYSGKGEPANAVKSMLGVRVQDRKFRKAAGFR